MLLKVVAGLAVGALIGLPIWRFTAPAEPQGAVEPNVQVKLPSFPQALPEEEAAEPRIMRSDVERPEENPIESSGIPVESRRGRVFHDGYPVEGADIRLWQSGELRRAQSDSQGYFDFDVDPAAFATVTAHADGMYQQRHWNPDDLRTMFLDLPDPEADIDVAVRDGVSGEAIADAHVQVFADWSGGRWGAYLRSSSLEPLLSGSTDEQGRLRVPSFAGLVKAFLVEAPGYLPHRGFGHEVVLFPDPSLPIQLVFPDGSPVANAEVRQGRIVERVELTDPDGFLPQVWEWTSVRSIEGVEALPLFLFVSLEDGRIWKAYGGGLGPEEVRIETDRIQLVVDPSPIRVELWDTPLPEGAWVEARCLQSGFPSLIPSGPDALWQRLEMRQEIELEQGWIGDSNEVETRLMPGRIPLGNFEIVDGLAKVTPTVGRMRLTLEGPSVEEGRPLHAQLTTYVLDRQFSEVPMVEMVDGVAEFPFLLREGNRYTIRIRDAEDSRFLLLQNGRGMVLDFTYAYPDSTDCEVLVREVPSRLEEVQIHVDGVPVLGGRVNNAEVDHSGRCRIPLGTDGMPMLRNLSMRLPAELHVQEGGPAIADLYFHEGEGVPGKMSRGRDGILTWDMELARVELMTRPRTRRESGGVYPVGSVGPVFQVRWPIAEAESAMFGLHLESPLEGGWLSFRVLSGTYAFRIGEVTYGTLEGTFFPPGRITQLHPDEPAGPDGE